MALQPCLPGCPISFLWILKSQSSSLETRRQSHGITFYRQRQFAGRNKESDVGDEEEEGEFELLAGSWLTPDGNNGSSNWVVIINFFLLWDRSICWQPTPLSVRWLSSSKVMKFQWRYLLFIRKQTGDGTLVCGSHRPIDDRCVMTVMENWKLCSRSWLFAFPKQTAHGADTINN